MSSRPSARRGPPSGSASRWREFGGNFNRLKPITIDPLEEYGLPSKGETRLNNFAKQEEFYKTVVTRYMQCCADSGGEELTNLFAAMALGGTAEEPAEASIPVMWTARENGKGRDKEKDKDKERPVSAHSTASSVRSDPSLKKSPTAELSLILSAMRKLREAIVASGRVDTFAQRAYVFIIHGAILVRHFESYQPALLHLLKHIHPCTPLSEPELHEFLGYHILDLACRENELGAAYAVKVAHGYKDARVEGVMKALANDNWAKFWKLRRAVDGYQAKLMESAEGAMRLHVLKCLGRTYMSIPRPFVEKATESTWDELVKQGVGWHLVEETNMITVRKVKAR